MYNAAVKDRVNIEDQDVLAGRVHGLLDPAAFIRALGSGKYEKALADANAYAYDRSEVWVVPAYRMGGRKLDSIEDVGVTKGQLAEFLAF
jgi:2-hydroxychromene-2-carboxylate isomerase